MATRLVSSVEDFGKLGKMIYTDDKGNKTSVVIQISQWYNDNLHWNLFTSNLSGEPGWEHSNGQQVLSGSESRYELGK
jgi:hypothetical protein